MADLGAHIAGTLQGPQDVGWVLADGTVWIVQARPITAVLPAGSHLGMPGAPGPPAVLNGTRGSHGSVTGSARIVRSPADFAEVHRREIVLCSYSAPAWPPLFTIAAGVITDTGGALAHAALVAREHGIPAVLGVDGASSRIENGARIVLDGTAGTVTTR